MNAGVFTFGRDNGSLMTWISFRVEHTMLQERKKKNEYWKIWCDIEI